MQHTERIGQPGCIRESDSRPSARIACGRGGSRPHTGGYLCCKWRRDVDGGGMAAGCLLGLLDCSVVRGITVSAWLSAQVGAHSVELHAVACSQQRYHGFLALGMGWPLHSIQIALQTGCSVALHIAGGVHGSSPQRQRAQCARTHLMQTLVGPGGCCRPSLG